MTVVERQAKLAWLKRLAANAAVDDDDDDDDDEEDEGINKVQAPVEEVRATRRSPIRRRGSGGGGGEEEAEAEEEEDGEEGSARRRRRSSARKEEEKEERGEKKATSKSTKGAKGRASSARAASTKRRSSEDKAAAATTALRPMKSERLQVAAALRASASATDAATAPMSKKRPRSGDDRRRGNDRGPMEAEEGSEPPASRRRLRQTPPPPPPAVVPVPGVVEEETKDPTPAAADGRRMSKRVKAISKRRETEEREKKAETEKDGEDDRKMSAKVEKSGVRKSTNVSEEKEKSKKEEEEEEEEERTKNAENRALVEDNEQETSEKNAMEDDPKEKENEEDEEDEEEETMFVIRPTVASSAVVTTVTSTDAVGAPPEHSTNEDDTAVAPNEGTEPLLVIKRRDLMQVETITELAPRSEPGVVVETDKDVDNTSNARSGQHSGRSRASDRVVSKRKRFETRIEEDNSDEEATIPQVSGALRENKRSPTKQSHRERRVGPKMGEGKVSKLESTGTKRVEGTHKKNRSIEEKAAIGTIDRKRLKRPLPQNGESRMESSLPLSLAAILDKEGSTNGEHTPVSSVKKSKKEALRIKTKEGASVIRTKDSRRATKGRSLTSLDDYLKAEAETARRKDDPPSLDQSLEAQPKTDAEHLKEEAHNPSTRSVSEHNGSQGIEEREVKPTPEQQNGLPTTTEDTITTEGVKNGDGCDESRETTQARTDSSPSDVLLLQPRLGKPSDTVVVHASTPAEVEEGAVSDDDDEASKAVKAIDQVEPVSVPDSEPIAFVIPKKQKPDSSDSSMPIPRRQVDPSARQNPNPSPSPSSSDVATPHPLTPSKPTIVRTKNPVPINMPPLTQSEIHFMRSAKKANSFLMAAQLNANPQVEQQKQLTVTAFGCTTVRYGVVGVDGKTFSEVTARMKCPTKKQLKSENHPPEFYGIKMPSPLEGVVEHGGTEASEEKKPWNEVPCYETLSFAHADDRDFYQRKLYGTTFVPQLLRGRITLVMRTARYQRKATGLLFNSQRDKEEYAAAVSARYTMNRTVPRCDIPQKNWQLLANGRTALLYLHYQNVEDAMLAHAKFVDDDNKPLMVRREGRIEPTFFGSAEVPSSSPLSSPPQQDRTNNSAAPAAPGGRSPRRRAPPRSPRGRFGNNRRRSRDRFDRGRGMGRSRSRSRQRNPPAAGPPGTEVRPAATGPVPGSPRSVPIPEPPMHTVSSSQDSSQNSHQSTEHVPPGPAQERNTGGFQPHAIVHTRPEERPPLQAPQGPQSMNGGSDHRWADGRPPPPRSPRRRSRSRPREFFPGPRDHHPHQPDHGPRDNGPLPPPPHGNNFFDRGRGRSPPPPHLRHEPSDMGRPFPDRGGGGGERFERYGGNEPRGERWAEPIPRHERYGPGPPPPGRDRRGSGEFRHRRRY